MAADETHEQETRQEREAGLVMSGRLMGQVWEIELPAPEQAVMLALADHGSDYPHIWGFGYNIFPSVELLAWKTGKTERQIQRILRTLEKMRVIVPVAYATGGRGKATKYEMHLENGAHKIWPEGLKGDIQGLSDETLKGDIQGLSDENPQKGDIQGLKGDIQGLKGDIQGLKGDIAMSPQPSYNHHSNHQRTVARVREDSSSQKIENDEEPEPEPEAESAEPQNTLPAERLTFSQYQRWYHNVFGLGQRYSEIHRAWLDYCAEYDQMKEAIS